MGKVESDYLLKNTRYFAENICATIKDMAFLDYYIVGKPTRIHPFIYSNGMIIYLHIGGAIQCDYILACSEKTALKMVDLYSDGMTDKEIRGLREEFSDLLKEVLNIAVGQSIVSVEKEFGSLTSISPIAVYGDIEFPNIMASSIDINGPCGPIKCVVCLNMIVLRIGKKLLETQQYLEERTKQAYTDGLTRLYNRAFFEEYYPEIVINSKNENNALSLLILDIDFFKKFNDSYGHKVGDFVLQKVAEVISETIRKGDVAIRYGGDEILIILPETSISGGKRLAQRIRIALRKNPVIHLKNKQQINLEVKLSIGIAELQDQDNPETLFNKADKAMYWVKQNGRNRVLTFDEYQKLKSDSSP